jgi:hypothetical protein
MTCVRALLTKFPSFWFRVDCAAGVVRAVHVLLGLQGV